jgi:hypothetical protein
MMMPYSKGRTRTVAGTLKQSVKENVWGKLTCSLGDVNIRRNFLHSYYTFSITKTTSMTWAHTGKAGKWQLWSISSRWKEIVKQDCSERKVVMKGTILNYSGRGFEVLKTIWAEREIFWVIAWWSLLVVHSCFGRTSWVRNRILLRKNDKGVQSFHQTAQEPEAHCLFSGHHQVVWYSIVRAVSVCKLGLFF